MFVSQKALVINSEGKILALRRSKTDPSRPLTWDLPGGELEEGEVLEENIKREIKEETGLEVEKVGLIHATAGYNQRKEYWVKIGYLSKVEIPTITLSYEHDKYQWLTKDEFLALESSDSIKQLLNAISRK